MGHKINVSEILEVCSPTDPAMCAVMSNVLAALASKETAWTRGALLALAQIFHEKRHALIQVGLENYRTAWAHIERGANQVQQARYCAGRAELEGEVQS